MVERSLFLSEIRVYFINFQSEANSASSESLYVSIFVSFHQSIPRLLDLLMNRGVSMLPDFHLVPLDLFCSPYSVLAVSQCTILMWFIRIKI